MKTKNKALLLSLCAVLLVAASVLGTMAYLTSQDVVTNTFTVGSVAITMDELDVDNDENSNDNVTYGEGENAVVRDKANAYKLLPGHSYTKDPIVHVDSKSEDCYLFVKVVNGITAIEDETTVANQMKANGWAVVEGVADTYVYIGTAENASAPLAVKAGDDVPVFESFKIKGDVTNDELAQYNGKTITVTAYAVQKDGFENTAAAEIWNTAFGTPAN